MRPEGTHHRLGIYYTGARDGTGSNPNAATYIHSKIMIVDDRFLTVGLGEPHQPQHVPGHRAERVSVETENAGDALGRSITHARQSLIAEHLGIPTRSPRRGEGLVATLDDLAARHEGRLRLHPSPTEKERGRADVVDPQQLPFDPAAVEDHDHRRSIFVGRPRRPVDPPRRGSDRGFWTVVRGIYEPHVR